MKKVLFLLALLFSEMFATMFIGSKYIYNNQVGWLIAFISSTAILIATALIITIVLCEERINEKEKKDE